MADIELFIDNTQISVPEGSTILEAAATLGIQIPTLCYHPDLSLEGACRVCSVEVEGVRNFLPACATHVTSGMRVKTNSPQIRQARRDILELILDNHPQDCQTCERDGNCELQNLAYTLGVRDRLFEGQRKTYPIETSSASVIRDPNKCILCRRCVRVCSEVQGISNLSQLHRGFHTVVAPAHEAPMAESVCINCGQCINVCPVAAFLEKSSTDAVWAALADPNKRVVVQVAPSIRAAIGEAFGLPIGTACTGKTVTALRRLGFDEIFDTNYGADLTIVEEGHEFLTRLQENQHLPMLTSCSPGWIKFLEHFYPELLPNASTCKSPMSMLSVLIKTFYAQQEQIDPESIYVVAIMPCVAKKFEIERPEHLFRDGIPYTDAVLTTRELAWMIKAYGVDFAGLPDDEFDAPMGFSTGAADIFGTTGGVMEAALRTAVEKLTGETLERIDFEVVRGVTGIKEASLEVAGKTINIGVANTLQSAKQLLDRALSGKKEYHLLELMACPGGCIGGGGQPYPSEGHHVLDPAVLQKRARALYSIDKAKTLRKSHENPYIQRLYKAFLGEPGGAKSHQLLHTHYEARLPKGIR
jgi:NADP-reducing hydrogenase subunit HndD